MTKVEMMDPATIARTVPKGWRVRCCRDYVYYGEHYLARGGRVVKKDDKAKIAKTLYYILEEESTPVDRSMAAVYRKRKEADEAYKALKRWLCQVTAETRGPLIDDGLISYCKNCGEGAWLVEKIEHSPKCEVGAVFRNLDILKGAVE